MTEEAQTTVEPRGDLRRMLPGVLVSILALAALLAVVDERQALEALKLADYRYLPVVLAGFIGTLASRAFAWRTILREQVTPGKTFLTLNEGYMINNLLPFRLGELGRALLLSRTAGLSFWEVLSTIVIERIFDVAIAAGMLLASLPFVIGAAWARQAGAAAGALVLALLGVLFVLARNQDWAMGLFERLAGRWPRLGGFGLERLKSFFGGLATLKEAGRFLRVLALMLVTWGFNLAWYYLLLKAFLPETQAIWALFAVGVSAMGVAVPSSPAYVGVLEAALVGALALFGVDESVGLAYAITAHTIYFVITVAIGAYALALDGSSLGQVYRQMRNWKGAE